MGLTDAEYEPIRSALFDGLPGQSATAAKINIADGLAKAGFAIVSVAERDRLAASLGEAERERKDAVIAAAQALCEAHYIATSIPSRPQTINRKAWTNLQLALHDYYEAQHG